MIILVAGLSGVGKTTFCKKVSSSNSRTLHIVASSVQKRCNETDFNSNQLNLIEEINKIVAESTYEIFLIDGHLFIKNKKVPIAAIRKLHLRAIVFIYEEANTIIHRREIDELRKRNVETQSQVIKSLEEQLEYCNYISKELDLPLVILQPSKQDTVLEFSQFISLLN
ncbi:ATP-binding protein [Pseudoalteromonas sp. SG44-8]|uniref:ATP-binding protein n=1 Tax=Pseudoalteromonas sp. SG44-8 TaxID=2760958 RepID=UPI0021761BFD|nr:ATP-binding protein [Pseudoalteromonas sp. SG44-8]